MLPVDDLEGYDSDEVPVVELHDDEMIYRDSNGTAAVILNQPAFAAPETQKKRPKKRQHKQRKNSSQAAQSSPMRSQKLSYSPPEKTYAMVEEPRTPKDVPPFFQILGAVAGRAKDFFGGPPVQSTTASAQASPTSHRKQVSLTPGFYPGKPVPQQYAGPSPKMPFNAYPDFYQQQQQQQQHQQLQQQQYMASAYGPNVFPPSPPMTFDQPPPAYFESQHKKKSKSHSKKKSKKSKKNKHTSEGGLADLTSNMGIALIFFAAGLLYMVTRSRPEVEGPISAAVDRTLANLQLGAVMAIAFAGAILGYRLFGTQMAPLEDASDNDDTASIFSIPAAGTVFGFQSPIMATRDLFNRISMGGPASTPMAQWTASYPPQVPGGYGMAPMHPQAAFPGAFNAPPPPGNQGPFPNMVQSYNVPFHDEEEEDSDSDLEFLPAGSLGHYQKMPFGNGSVSGPFSPVNGAPKIDGLTPEMLQEEAKRNYYEDLPFLPGMNRQPVDPAAYKALIDSPDPELLEEIRQPLKKAEVKKEKRSPKASPKVSERKEKKAVKTQEIEARSPTEKKKVYSDDYSCKPYGPPPNRYMGVNF